MQKKKCPFIYFVLLSHKLSQASQSETDLKVEFDEMK